MPMRLEGSCRCGAISFSVDSHTPYPYQRCYCSICRKSAGGGGYAINDCMAHHLMTALRAATLCIEKKPCARSLVRGDRQAAA